MRLIHIHRLLIIACVLCSATLSAKCETKHFLMLRPWQFDMSWQCSTAVGTYLAGGKEGFSVRITKVSAIKYPSLEEGWPQGLTVYAGHLNDTTFVSDADLLRSLELTRLVNWFQRAEDSTARAAKRMSDWQKSVGLRYNFSISIPEALAGQRIYLQADYYSDETGKLTDIIPLDIVVPCDESAMQRMRGSLVREANFEGRHDLAASLADSLVALGWADLTGLVWATQSAAFADRRELELKFLDLNYQTNGCIELTVSGNSDTARQQQAQLYARKRQRLVEIIQQEH
jgi:hypothetical protein